MLTIEIERKIPVLVGAFQHGAVMHEACGVEQDVDRARAFCHLGNRGAVAHIQTRYFRNALLGERCEALFVDIGCENRGALARKGDRRRAANARRARSHECAFTLEAVSHVVLPSFLSSFRGATKSRARNP
jgi:hypothetical protein